MVVDHDNIGENNSDGDVDDVVEEIDCEELSKEIRILWQQIRDRCATGLRPDGPAVDYAALNLYIDRMLSPDQMAAVRELIGTWRSWFDAHWELWTSLQFGKMLDEHLGEGWDSPSNERPKE